MRILIDNQLPLALAVYFRGRGHDRVHVLEVNLDEADDRMVWDLAVRENRILVSEDQDFTFLANRTGDAGRFMWIRLGNCRNDALLRSVDGAHDEVVAAFESGQRIVEVH
jgi:predicted nuclease of predicted toxin-antitoxin system